MITKTRIAGVLTALVCGALILFGVLFGLMPQLAAAENTNGLAQDARSLNDTYRVQLGMLEQADQNSSQLEASLGELRQALPDTADSAAWIDELRQLEKSTSTYVKQFEVKQFAQEQQAAAAPTGGGSAPAEDSAASAPPTGPLAIPITLQVAGANYKDAAKFVDAVQNGSRLFLVRHAQILEQDSDGGAAWYATLDGFIYALPEPK